MKHIQHICILLWLTVASNVFADGMMMTSAPYYIEETGQQALITYDQASSSETLSILPSFRGDTNDFAWIIPVPNQPALEEGSEQVFRDLRSLTSPRYHYRDGDWDGCDRQNFSPDSADGGGFEIIDSQLVGYYQTMILAAEQAPALLAVLTHWGFLHSENIDQATDLITDYVERDWYFVTVRVDSTSFAEAFPHGYSQYYGHLQPLTLTFNNDEIIYPMRISALSAAESTEVNLFVVGDHRVNFTGATTRYANRFSQKEYSDLRWHPSLRGYLNPGDFLTHLQRNFAPNDMNEDLTIVRAGNDDEYLQINYSGVPWLTIFLLGPPALWGSYRWLTRKRKDVRLRS